MRGKKIIFPALILIFLNGCYFFTDKEFLSLQQDHVEKIKKIESENRELLDENEKLKQEVRSLKVDKNEYIQALNLATKDGNHRDVIKYASMIEMDFPDSKEAIIAKKSREISQDIINKKLYNATKSLKLKENKTTKTKWYYDKTEEYKLPTTPLFLYIEEREHSPLVLKLRLQTTEATGNFTKGFSLLGDGGTYNIIPTKEDLKQKQIAGGVWIWSEKKVTKKDITMLKDIIYSKSPSVRFLKESGYEELPLALKTRQSMIRVINGYLAMENISTNKE